jgi:hypothetical protein
MIFAHAGACLLKSTPRLKSAVDMSETPASADAMYLRLSGQLP